MADGLIRRARPDEAAELTALAVRSKAHWPYDEALMSVFRRTIVLTPREIADHHALAHEIDGKVDAVGLLILGRPDCEIDHLWVDPSAIGRGVGRAMAAALIEAARDHGAARVVLNSDPYAEPFYRRLGFERIGDHPVDDIPGRVLPRMGFTLNAD